MLTIHKFRLVPGDNRLPLPPDAQILTVQMQDGNITCWCMLDDQQPCYTRPVLVAGTGWELPPEPGRYIGTVQTLNGLVWHVFDRST